MTLTLAGSLARLVMVIPSGGGRGILTLILLRVMEQLAEGHVAALLGLVIKVAPGDVAAGVHSVQALIGAHKTIVACGHPLQLLQAVNSCLQMSKSLKIVSKPHLVLKIKMNLR